MAVESFLDQVSTKECVGRGDRTRGRLHAMRKRFQSSYRARPRSQRMENLISDVDFILR